MLRGPLIGLWVFDLRLRGAVLRILLFAAPGLDRALQQVHGEARDLVRSTR